MNVYVREYQKIENRTRRRDNFLLRYLPILLLLGAAVIVGKIYTQSVAIRWSHRLMEQKQKARDLEFQNEELTRSIAGLTTRERVASDASRELDMIVPTNDDVVWLPVLDRTASEQVLEPVDIEEASRPGRAIRTWIDGLWQEEALALTSQ